jgi:hypothetical protein
MGYWSSFHLVDVKIKSESLSAVERDLKNSGGRRLAPIRDFLCRAVLDRDSFLVFKASEDGGDPYVPNEEDWTVPALYGKWAEAERIASWLKHHSEKGGRIVFHSIEADGSAWGWEFDGKGRMRHLGLKAVGKWK